MLWVILDQMYYQHEIGEELTQPRKQQGSSKNNIL